MCVCVCPGSVLVSIRLAAVTSDHSPGRVHCFQQRAGGPPAARGTRSDDSPLPFPFRSNGETMGSPPEGWPVFVACVFVLHRVFTQNTSGPLRTRSAHPSNLLCRQRDTVSPRNSPSPRVTLRPHRGSCCQPGSAEEQRRCPAKHFVLCPELQPWMEHSVQTVRPQDALSKVSQVVTTTHSGSKDSPSKERRDWTNYLIQHCFCLCREFDFA